MLGCLRKKRLWLGREPQATHQIKTQSAFKLLETTQNDHFGFELETKFQEFRYTATNY